MDDYTKISSYLLIGGGTALVIAKYAITKALSNLDSVVEKAVKIDREFSAFSVHLDVCLEMIKEHDMILKDHAKKLAYLEGAHHERGSQGTLH